MDFKLVKFSEVDRTTWDNWVKQIPECNYYHSWDWLNYALKLPNIEEHLSFALLNTDGNLGLSAICPLAVSRDASGVVTLSFNGVPCGIPALADMTHSQRRKTLDQIFAMIQQHAQRTQAKKIQMIHHSLNNSCSNGERLAEKYAFEPLRYQLVPSIFNICVMDLSESEEKFLGRVSKFQRKNIQRAEKRGVVIKIFDGQTASVELEQQMREFQQLHFKVSGRATRPQATWDAMKEGIVNKNAALFVAYLEKTPISYLYCGEFGKMAYGFSQVNDPEFEKEYSPRHLLEWQAMVEYQKRGFRFYEIGTSFAGPQLFYTPTEKEKSISVFKERYGGIFLTRIFWTGYYDRELMKSELTRQMNDFINSMSQEPATVAIEEE